MANQPNEHGASSQAEALVERQLVAYNARDLDAFVATYHESIEVYEHPNELKFRGHQALRQTYAERFAQSPNIHATISKRIAHGDHVIDHETVTGYNGDQTITVVAIYQVEDGLIRRVWFIR